MAWYEDEDRGRTYPRAASGRGSIDSEGGPPSDAAINQLQRIFGEIAGEMCGK